MSSPVSMLTPGARLVLAAMTALSLTACNAVRRPFAAPTPAAPTEWSRSDGTAPASPTLDASAEWWTSFGDPLLTQYIQRAVSASFDVRTAISRIREARARLAVSRADLLPDANVSVSTTGGRSSSQTAQGTSTSTQANYQMGADASWEADIVGGTRSAIDAAAATADARNADLQDVVVTLTADVANAYITVRSLQERLAIATQNAATQEDTYSLTGFRQQAGLATALDVEQARANLENTRAQMASLRLQLAQAQHALAVLLAQPPASLDAELGVVAPVPEASLTLAVGLPADVLRRRPDVRSAERSLASQAAQVNAARADLYPRLSLTGSIGLETLRLAKWLLPSASFWSVGPSLSLQVFDRRSIRQNIAIQDELESQAVTTYESQVLTALSDVEDALVALVEEQARRERLADATAAAQRAAELALQMYSAGLSDFRDVLDAQRTLLTYQDDLASSRANVSSNLVSLYRAAGGGWSIAPAP